MLSLLAVELVVCLVVVLDSISRRTPPEGVILVAATDAGRLRASHKDLSTHRGALEAMARPMA